jgi:hypothetical protein
MSPAAADVASACSADGDVALGRGRDGGGEVVAAGGGVEVVTGAGAPLFDDPPQPPSRVASGTIRSTGSRCTLSSCLDGAERHLNAVVQLRDDRRAVGG